MATLTATAREGEVVVELLEGESPEGAAERLRVAVESAGGYPEPERRALSLFEEFMLQLMREGLSETHLLAYLQVDLARGCTPWGTVPAVPPPYARLRDGEVVRSPLYHLSHGVRVVSASA